MIKSKCDSCKGCNDKNAITILEDGETKYNAIIEECNNYKKEK